jgi:cation diffusion facilitator CzcD-associated flavoprotein CzcO
MDSIVFDSDVRELRWDEAAARWTIVLERGGKREEHHANAVITAAGYLTRAQFPDVPGRERFSGPSFHSAEWQDDCDLTGQRIGVVGTGCTSVQIVDALIDQVGSLTLFQRQPHWVMPPAGEARLPASQLWLLENVPSFAQWSRLALYLLISDALYPQVRYDAQWAATHDLSISPQNDVQLQRGLAHLQASFADRPDLIAKLTPGFAPFGKRPIRDPGGYFTALKHPKSTVVSSGLREVVPEGIVDAEGTLHALDAIVYATGFRLDFLAQWRIEGRDGRTLAEVWQDSPVAYNGCLVPGFPNLFITSGPHASAAHGGGHNFTVEAVVHYAIECLQTLFETGHSSVEVSPEAQQRWAEEVQDALADSVWVRETRATTYYRNGKGEVILASPFRMEDYWNRLRQPDLLDITLR